MKTARTKSGQVITESMPEDMIELVRQVLEEWADKDIPKYLPVREIRLEDLPTVDFKMSTCDDRGLLYANDMIGVVDLPPLVSIGNILIDGRHRLHAARCEEKQTLLVIDLSKWVDQTAVPAFMNLGEIKSPARPTANVDANYASEAQPSGATKMPRRLRI